MNDNTMRPRRTRLLAAALMSTVVLVLVGGLATAASAQEEPVPTLTSATVPAGGSEDVSGTGCVASSKVEVQLDGVVVVTATSDAAGGYTAHFVVPVTSPTGNRQLTVACNTATGPKVFRATLTVALPKSGVATVPLLELSLVLMALGTGLVFTSDRLRAARARA